MGCGIRRTDLLLFHELQDAIDNIRSLIVFGCEVLFQVAKIIILKLFLKGPPVLQRSKGVSVLYGTIHPHV